MTDTADCGGIPLEAHAMSRVEFDAHRPHDHDCPTCRTPLYSRRRHTGLQEFVHRLPAAARRCPDAQGESLTHHDMKESLAAAGERIGLRADTEVPIGNRRADVGLYRPDQLSTEGPLMVLEAQHSQIDPVEFHERDRNHWDALNALHQPGKGDRRAAAWFFNGFHPSCLTGAAFFVVDRETHGMVTGGLYKHDAIEGRPFIVPADKLVQAIQRGGVYKIIDGPITRWVARPGLFLKAPRGKRRPLPRRAPDLKRHAGECTREPAAPELGLVPPQPAQRALALKPWVGPLPPSAKGPCRVCQRPVEIPADDHPLPIHHRCLWILKAWGADG